MGRINSRQSIDLLFGILEKNIDSLSGDVAISSLKELGKKQLDHNKRSLVERLLSFFNKTQHKNYLINKILLIIAPEKLIPYLNKLNVLRDNELGEIINDIKNNFPGHE